jgi:hypothetical protein
MATSVKLPGKLSQNAFMGHCLRRVHECVPTPVGHGAVPLFHGLVGVWGDPTDDHSEPQSETVESPGDCNLYGLWQTISTRARVARVLLAALPSPSVSTPKAAKAPA